MNDAAQVTVRAIVHRYAPNAGDHDGLGHLQSLEMIALIEDLEDALGVRVSGADVTPENFASIAHVVAFLAAR